MNPLVNFIDSWQTLIGAALGPFLAVVLSAIFYLLKAKRERATERRESLRRIEVGITSTLNDVYKVRDQLNIFIESLTELENNIRYCDNPAKFSLEKLGFPSFQEIYSDPEVRNLKVRSYYLHNKLMVIDAGVKGTNGTLISLREQLAEIYRSNEILVGLMQANPNPHVQCQTYANNLEVFATAVYSYTESLTQPIRTLIQVKIYNEWLRKRYGYWTWWKIENAGKKFFWTKSAQNQFTKSIEALDRMDKLLDERVQEVIEKIEKRSVSISK